MSYCKKFLPYSRDNVPFVILKERIENVSGNECLIKRACLALSAGGILKRPPYEEDLFNTYGISCDYIDEESIAEIYENCPLIDRNIIIVTEQEEVGVKAGVLLANYVKILQKVYVDAELEENGYDIYDDEDEGEVEGILHYDNFDEGFSVFNFTSNKGLVEICDVIDLSFVPEDVKGEYHYGDRFTKSLTPFVIVTGLKPDRYLEARLSGIATSRNALRIMVINHDTYFKHEMQVYLMDKDCTTVVVDAVEDSYYEGVLKRLLALQELKIKEENISRFIFRTKRIFGKNFSEEMLVKIVTDAKKSKDKARDKGNGETDEKYFGRFFEKEDSAREKLSKMNGLTEFKALVKEYLAVLKAERENKNLKTMHRNLIFTGRPGTGKTTCAKLLADILSEEGMTNATFNMVSRADIIGKYIGQTAPKITELFNNSRNGIIFVDEAGFFANDAESANSFVKEAIKEFVRYMELYPDVIVIFALYDNELQDFLRLDKGLESRIRKTIYFKDYSVPELVRIFEEKLDENGYSMAKNLGEKLEEIFENEIKSENFANARTVRKLVEEAITKFGIRTFREENPERVIILEDISR
ncbi:MAG: AAA family ATPase [Catonella sp.]|uniref:AAA family ATPase n=1 Tax=Catonella sp. TaxID=2382125 RepID=UPI003FA03EFA